MDVRLRAGYFFAGMLFTNSLPHFAVGFTGRHNITPLKRDSSPALNVLWALLNFVGGYLVLRKLDGTGGVRADSHEWLLAL